MFCCLKGCLDTLGYSNNVPMRVRENPVRLDTSHMGHEVVIVKGGRRVCGSGAALASAPLVQSKSYFEVKLQQAGSWSVGVATRQADLNHSQGGNDKESWCLNSDCTVRHDNVVIHSLPTDSANPDSLSSGPLLGSKDPGDLISSDVASRTPTEGDTLGVSYDHIALNFYLNGKDLEIPVNNVRGTVYPVLYVDEGAILDIILDDFTHTPPPGFSKIMIEQSLL
ncbi:SPRY domain-containing protein 7-like [Ctenocephalides felis]|uniref:SPRY domain-containing protein 7-like n=1 Tax=Ctenocephalides felis TaxID=7515 RepID=UPI000E6E2D6D|nr:SPRY domain-containing protein 7-like [Ctenocephalides felis]